MSTPLGHNFDLIYLGNIPDGIVTGDRYLLSILLAASKKAITKRWLNEEPPTISEWKDITREIREMERLTLTIRHQKDKFIRYWTKWDEYDKKDTD